MIKIQELSLFDLITETLAKDRSIKALFYAADKQLQEITSAICENILLPHIDELPETITDHLATQMHVDFYKPLGLDIVKKRELVKKSFIAHRYKGTKYAIETVLQTLYGNNVTIIPWFEYSGKPYHFKVYVVLDGINNNLDKNEMFLAVDCYKSARDVSDGIHFISNSQAPLYTGAFLHCKYKMTVGERSGGGLKIG